MLDCIKIQGARQNNLKNISLEIPRDKLVVITGISGSGKSSLAFDTIYAEGQRRYVESLSTYARQFLGQMDKPDVDYIEGLSPAVSIDQKSTTRNPRSTVGTVTEIYDYLRLLFARIGKPHCPKCGSLISQQTVEQIVDRVMNLPEGSRIQVLSPLVRGRKGEFKDILEEIKREGFVRTRVDGKVIDLEDLEALSLDRYKNHTIEVVVDRLIVKPEIRTRLADSLEQALKMGNGLVSVDVIDGKEMTFSEKFACVKCGISFEELAPRNFSFNTPYGSCPECQGLGVFTEIDPNLVIDPNLSISDGGVVPFAHSSSDYMPQIFESLSKQFNFSLDTPLGELTETQLNSILHGVANPIPVIYHGIRGFERSYNAHFEGVVPMLKRRYEESNSEDYKQELEQYMSSRPCPSCHGKRLKPESLAVTIGRKNIAEVTELSVSNSLSFFKNLKLTEREHIIADRILKEIESRLGFLENVGLNYLTLDRAAATLAGGEAQRIRLATQIGSGLMGVLYILDEPSIGLHQRDNSKLIQTLLRLRDLGNTVLVVEHDEETIRTADWVVDIGPGAGEHGGYLVSEGTPDQITSDPNSVTGQFLSGKRSIPIPENRRACNGNYVEIRGAREHNLKKINVKIPLGVMVCVTGVSGSGKSTLIQEILYPRLRYELYGTRCAWGQHESIKGLDNIDKVINMDQSPIGRTPRSNPATYTGVFTMIRELFAATNEAKVRGYKPGRFSFNVKGGRCEKCHGDGILRIEMNFLPDVYVPCETCKGARYNRETLEVNYKGKSIAEILNMTVGEALEFFKHIPSITNKLSTLHDVGLDYIRLGQPATTLSGGEAQRIKLATELSKKSTGHTLYILDEPTTGLHFADIAKLLDVLGKLVDQGNTVLIIEHNMDVIKTADWIIDLGPEGGDGGGKIVAQGIPEEVARIPESHTGEYLAKYYHLDQAPLPNGKKPRANSKKKKDHIS